jgi:hypothetical protein
MEAGQLHAQNGAQERHFVQRTPATRGAAAEITNQITFARRAIGATLRHG